MHRERANMREANRWRNNHPSKREMLENDPSILEEARSHVEQLNLFSRSVPGVGHAEYLIEAGLPVWCGDRVVHELSITRGDPQHGAKRSDDHVGYTKIEAPIVDFDISMGDSPLIPVCPECGDERALFIYRAHHHIAGSHRVVCRTCGETLDQEEWG